MVSFRGIADSSAMSPESALNAGEQIPRSDPDGHGSGMADGRLA
jgi:hypothetical protein